MTIIVEYIWIGGNLELRSKCKILGDFSLKSVEDFPCWNYDGSSTNQASGCDSEVIIKPKTYYRDPFRKNFNSYLVLCDTYLPNGQPHSSNSRFRANEIFNKKLEEEPWFGLEQEYFLIDLETNKPFGMKNFIKQGQYYCSVGGANAFGRKIIEEHMEACIYSGLKISGVNAEVAPGQWEFQVGPAFGIEAGDHLWMARYLLERITEKYNVRVEYGPKPFHGDINGTGCHCNFSTKNMREGVEGKTGLEIIDEALVKLSLRHKEHMEVYGEGNRDRMTGHHETASYDEFSFGRANRGRSVRIGNETIDSRKGYFEDRRPAGNSDPYLVTSIIFETTCL